MQIHDRSRKLDLNELRRRLSPTVAEVRNNDFLLRFRVPALAATPAAGSSSGSSRTTNRADQHSHSNDGGYEITVFSDGRAIIKGTRDPAVARSLYARYIGS